MLSTSLSSPVSDQQLPETHQSVAIQRTGETPSDTTGTTSHSQQANEGMSVTVCIEHTRQVAQQRVCLAKQFEICNINI